MSLLFLSAIFIVVTILHVDAGGGRDAAGAIAPGAGDAITGLITAFVNGGNRVGRTEFFQYQHRDRKGIFPGPWGYKYVSYWNDDDYNKCFNVRTEWWNDSFSKVDTDGLRLKVFQHKDCGGYSLIIGPGEGCHFNLGDCTMPNGETWDNQISSYMLIHKSSDSSKCLPLWANTCTYSEQCCSGNCDDNSGQWSLGVCKP